MSYFYNYYSLRKSPRPKYRNIFAELSVTVSACLEEDTNCTVLW